MEWTCACKWHGKIFDIVDVPVRHEGPSIPSTNAIAVELQFIESSIINGKNRVVNRFQEALLSSAIYEMFGI